MLAASNELPAKGEGLEALWDRFIIRQLVSNITEPSNFNDFITSTNTKSTISIPDNLKISDDEFNTWQKKIDKVTVSDEALNVINVIRNYIQKYNSQEEQEFPIYVSDRRWKKIVRVLKTSAFLNERKSIDLMDCFLIAHTIWNEVEQIEIVNEFVIDAIKKHGYSLKCGLNEFESEINNLVLDIKNEINVTKTISYYVPIEIKINGDVYYEVNDFLNIINSKYKYIRKDDFFNLDAKTYKEIHLYDKYGSPNYYNHSNRFQVAKLKDNEVFVRKNTNTNDGIAIPLKTNQRQKQEKVTQRPHQAIIEAWNRQISEIKVLIDNELKNIKTYQENELGTLKQNLFVTKDLAKYVEVNINQTIEQLLSQKAKLIKLQEAYENL